MTPLCMATGVITWLIIYMTRTSLMRTLGNLLTLDRGTHRVYGLHMNNTDIMNNIIPFTHMTAAPHPAAMAAAQLLMINDCLGDLDGAIAIIKSCIPPDEDDSSSIA